MNFIIITISLLYVNCLYLFGLNRDFDLKSWEMV